IEATAQQMMAKIPGLAVGKLEDTKTGAALSMKYNGKEISGKTLEEAMAKFTAVIEAIPADQVAPEAKAEVIAAYQGLPTLMRRYVVSRQNEQGSQASQSSGQNSGLWGRIKGF